MQKQLKELDPMGESAVEADGSLAEMMAQLAAVSPDAKLVLVLQEDGVLQTKAAVGFMGGLQPPVSWSPDIVLASPGPEVLRGAELAGHPVASLFSDYATFLRIPVYSVSGGEPVGFLWVWEVAAGVFSSEGLPLLQLFSRQIALELDRQQTRVALCQATTNIRRLEHHLDGGSWVCHLPAGLITCSEQVEQILGRCTEKGMPLSWKELLGYFEVDERVAFWKQGQVALQQESEVRFSSKLNSDATIRIWGEPVYEQGVLVRYEGLVQRLANPDGDRFANTNVGHELRSGVYALKEIAGFLIKEELPAPPKDHLYLLHLSAQHLATLLDYTLDPATMVPRDLRPDPRTFNIRELLQEVHKALQVNAQGKKLDFDFVVEQDIPEYLVGDPECLGYILKNLTLNSFLFTNKGYVKILVDVLYQSDRELVLEFIVVDSGVGISGDGQMSFEVLPSDVLARHNPLKNRVMGLDFTNRLVDMLHGALQVNSTPHEGTEFYFRLKFGKASFGKADRLQPGTLP